jgi:hypothetical protein
MGTSVSRRKDKKEEKEEGRPAVCETERKEGQQ